MKKQNNGKLRIIPLGGLEQIGMNITERGGEAERVQEFGILLPLSMKTVLLSWTAVWHSRRMICLGSIL